MPAPAPLPQAGRPLMQPGEGEERKSEDTRRTRSNCASGARVGVRKERRIQTGGSGVLLLRGESNGGLLLRGGRNGVPPLRGGRNGVLLLRGGRNGVLLLRGGRQGQVGVCCVCTVQTRALQPPRIRHARSSSTSQPHYMILFTSTTLGMRGLHT